jgi:hypothetical protein
MSAIPVPLTRAPGVEVWRLVPGTTGLYASPDGRWTVHVEYAVWILTDRASAVITADRITYPTRGFYTLAALRAYVASVTAS